MDTDDILDAYLRGDIDNVEMDVLLNKIQYEQEIVVDHSGFFEVVDIIMESDIAKGEVVYREHMVNNNPEWHMYRVDNIKVMLHVDMVQPLSENSQGIGPTWEFFIYDDGEDKALIKHRDGIYYHMYEDMPHHIWLKLDNFEEIEVIKIGRIEAKAILSEWII
jgi:hypothetical protein